MEGIILSIAILAMLYLIYIATRCIPIISILMYGERKRN